MSKKCKLTAIELYDMIIIGSYGDFCMRRKVVLSLSIIVIMGSIIAIGNRPVHNFIEYDENTTLALFDENGEKIDKVPSKDSGYTLDTEKSSCTNGSISWDTKSWSPVITASGEVKGRVSCTLYFKEVTAYDECVMEYGTDSINCQIIAELDEDNCPNVNEDGSVNINSIEAENAYVCSTPDDYGTSYYYRGNVTNNYVKFGQNEQGQDMYWRIIRINGDGSIRMIYDGTSAHANNDSSADRQVGTSAYNSSRRDNAYVGYMYGTAGSSTYEDTHANTNDSTIKAYLDNWYKTNIEDKGLSSYISDTLFCNDRSFNSGTGIGASVTYYRWYRSSNGIRLTCPNQNDRFTVNDELIGNGDLTYPIGLINTDEVYLAGGYSASNSGYYLYTGNYYWTMSPVYFSGGYAHVRFVSSGGFGDSDDRVNNLIGVRPTLNLLPDSLKVGSGTADDPWRIVD